jgi:hypothetical protein
MRACKVDRQKLQLWKIWLGVEPVSSITEVAREEDLAYAGLGISPSATTESLLKAKKEAALKQAKSRWRKAFAAPDVMDVWDLLERRLDQMLLVFEYQGSRASLLHLLLTLHATSHSNHRFQNTRWSLQADNNQSVEPNAPSQLSPMFGSRQNGSSSLDILRSQTPAGDEWRVAKVPRLEFWSDLEKCARSLLEKNGTNTPPNTQRPNGSPSPRMRSATAPSTAVRGSNGTAASRRLGPNNLTSSTRGEPIHRSTTPSLLGENEENNYKLLADLLKIPMQSQKNLLGKAADYGEANQDSGRSTPRLIRQLNESVDDA